MEMSDLRAVIRRFTLWNSLATEEMGDDEMNVVLYKYTARRYLSL